MALYWWDDVYISNRPTPFSLVSKIPDVQHWHKWRTLRSHPNSASVVSSLLDSARYLCRTVVDLVVDSAIPPDFNLNTRMNMYHGESASILEISCKIGIKSRLRQHVKQLDRKSCLLPFADGKGSVIKCDQYKQSYEWKGIFQLI